MIPRTPDALTFILDTRESLNPHPWLVELPPGSRVIRGTLETGDLAIAGLEEYFAVERKTMSDLAGCLGKERDRWERELGRSRTLAGFAVVVEGSWESFLSECHNRRNFSVESVEGSIAAWARRYRCPFQFAGTQRLAARWAFRFLAGAVTEAADRLAKVRGASNRSARAVARAEIHDDEPEGVMELDSPF